MVNLTIMPHPPSTSNDAFEHEAFDLGLQLPDHEPRKRKNSVLGRFQRIGNWFKEDEALSHPPPVALPDVESQEEIEDQQSEKRPARRPSLLNRRGYKRVVPELPRPLTFR